MKNTVKLLVALSVCALLFVSCKKDDPVTPTPDTPVEEEVLEGQYMPDKKLSVLRSANIDMEDGTESFITVYTYHWDGKLLSDIVATNGITGSGLYKCTFTYDSKNRVEKITSETDVTSVYKFIYTDKELTKVEGYFDSDELTDEYLFTRTDGKVTQITHHNYDGTLKKGDFKSLSFFFPEQIVMAMETASMAADKADGDVTNLIWEGDNIVKTELVTTATLITDYTYDNKVNPLKGLYKNDFESTPETLYSSNNVLTTKTEIPVFGTIENTHTYEYDGDYPVKDVIEMHSTLSDTKTVNTYTYL